MSSDLDNITGIDEEIESGSKVEARYFLVGFILVSFLLSEVGNIFLTVNLYKKKRNKVTAKIISVMSATEVGIGLFSILPACITITGQKWYFGSIGCVVQGMISTILLLVKGFYMLLLAIDRIYVVTTKKSPKCIEHHCGELIASAILLSGFLASLPLLREIHYSYVPGLHQCYLSSSSFAMFVNLVTYVIPYIIVIFLTFVSLEKSVCRSNRVMALQDGNACEMRRLGVARASLLPNDNAIEVTESNLLQKAEIRTTLALSYLTIPISFLYLLSFVLKTASTNTADKQETLASASLALHSLASIIQPFILFIVSTALRKSFVQLFTRKTETRNHTPIFHLSQKSPHARDEGVDTDIPTFLRNPSAMPIRFQVSSGLNLKENLNTDDMRLSSTSSINSENRAENGLQVLNAKVDRRHSLQSTNGESIDSLFVNFDASVDSHSRWSVSTASVMTLSIPDKQMPCTRASPRLSRVMSEKMHEKMKAPLSPTSSINSELILRTHTLPTSVKRDMLSST